MYIVEYIQDSVIQTAWVLEEQSGKLRLLLPNRRELSLSESRVLPWKGPTFKNVTSKDEAVNLLTKHKEKREVISKEVDILDIWELAQGEVESADLKWLTELVYSEADIDTLAGVARSLLADKVHFRFNPPLFEIFPQALVEAKEEAEKVQKERERLIQGGMEWLKLLWDNKQNNKPIPACTLDEDVQKRLKHILLARITDPETKDDEGLWKQVNKSLPDDAFVPLILAMAWGIVPEHYNYWLDRAGYSLGDWYSEYSAVIEDLLEKAEEDTSDLSSLPFISVDGATTKDIDDAFFVEKSEDGWNVTIALACPAAYWDFNSPFDKVVSQRATSLYLPEGTYHMLPESLGIGSYSLHENTVTPSLLVQCKISEEGVFEECKPIRARAKVKANLVYSDVEIAIEGTGENKATPYREMLLFGMQMAEKRLAKRIENGAIIINRPDPLFKVEFDDTLPPYFENARVIMEDMEDTPKAQLLISELMVLANAGIATWANAQNMPLLYRTQDIALPKEYAGVWSKPEDISRITRSLSAASMEVQPKPHAGMGLSAYSPITSPLRRYADLINQAQVLYYLLNNTLLWTKEELENVLMNLNIHLESSSLVQRMRPRYWKLMYFKQQSKIEADAGNNYPWDAVITEENDTFVSVSLPKEQLFLRAKRTMFSEKIQLGQKISLRLGKIIPLRNEIQILGVIDNLSEDFQDFPDFNCE